MSNKRRLFFLQELLLGDGRKFGTWIRSHEYIAGWIETKFRELFEFKLINSVEFSQTQLFRFRNKSFIIRLGNLKVISDFYIRTREIEQNKISIFDKLSIEKIGRLAPE